MAGVLPITRPLSSLDALKTTLRRYAHELPSEELPAFVGALETAKALAWIRLAAAEREAQEERTPAGVGRLLNAKAMAERLQVPESWLRERARGGRVPCVYVGRYMRFDPECVRRALDAKGEGVISTGRNRTP